MPLTLRESFPPQPGRAPSSSFQGLLGQHSELLCSAFAQGIFRMSVLSPNSVNRLCRQGSGRIPSFPQGSYMGSAGPSCSGVTPPAGCLALLLGDRVCLALSLASEDIISSDRLCKTQISQHPSSGVDASRMLSKDESSESQARLQIAHFGAMCRRTESLYSDPLSVSAC